MRAAVVSLFVLSSGIVGLAAACEDQTNPVFGGGGPLLEAGDQPDSNTDAGTDAADAPSSGDAGIGSGTIAGSVGGSPFTAVMSAYWIGAPDSAATTALYLIGKPIACADITTSGWSHTIAAGTQIFEMILVTKTPPIDRYTVSTAASPPVGGAEVQLIVAAPQRNETRATTGTIDLTKLIANNQAAGTFNVQFGAAGDASDDAGDGGANGLTGTFTAAYCAAGHEP